MPAGGKEPQSYGSGAEWVTGETGQKVNDPKATPPAEHRAFYDSEHEQTSDPHQGGDTSHVQRAENPTAPEGMGDEAEERQPVTSVTAEDGGAKQDSFFRKRDYE